MTEYFLKFVKTKINLPLPKTTFVEKQQDETYFTKFPTTTKTAGLNWLLIYMG